MLIPSSQVSQTASHQEARVMFPSSSGTPQLLLVLLYARCFLLSLPLDAPRQAHAAAAAPPPFSFSFDFSNQSLYDRDDLRLEGNATMGTNQIELTCNSAQSIGNCTGRMSYNHPVPFYKANDKVVASFSTVFTFKIVPPAPRFTGDGMAFFLTGYPSALPPDSNGGCLGLVDRNTKPGYGTDQFVAVVFDTYTVNVSSDHIGINLNSVLGNTTTVASLSGTMTASVSFNSTTRMLVARLVEVSAVLPDRVTSLLPPEVAVGFSAATGRHTELHQLLSWSFNSTLAPKKPKLIGTSQIAEIVVGACVFLLLVWFILSWFMRKRGRNSIMAGAGLRQFLYRELVQATNNFSSESKLGEGAYGAVYKGKSLNVNHGQKRDVAIKEIFKGSSEERQDFLTELNIITKTKHKNLVRLEGRSRPSRLHKNKDTVLPWPARYHIVKGIASALVYLHHDCRPYILHRDIKPANILLDDEYNAKLADFGISRIGNENNATMKTLAVGTRAYMDPHCIKDGPVKFKPITDVYSFGLVLLEIACAGRKSREIIWELYRTNGANTLMVEDVADERLQGNFDRDQMLRVLVVGLWCSFPEGSNRPSMRQALRLLEQDDTPLPDLASCAISPSST